MKQFQFTNCQCFSCLKLQIYKQQAIKLENRTFPGTKKYYNYIEGFQQFAMVWDGWEWSLNSIFKDFRLLIVQAIISDCRLTSIMEPHVMPIGTPKASWGFWKAVKQYFQFSKNWKNCLIVIWKPRKVFRAPIDMVLSLPCPWKKTLEGSRGRRYSREVLPHRPHMSGTLGFLPPTPLPQDW